MMILCTHRTAIVILEESTEDRDKIQLRLFVCEYNGGKYNRLARMQLSCVLKGETYSQNVKCKVREWTDDVNIKNEFWFRHTVLLPASVSVYPVPLTE